MSLILSGPYTQLSQPTQRGFDTVFCQRQTGRLSPTTGWTFDQDFRSLSYFNTQALANIYAAAGIEYELTLQGGLATLRTTDTTGNITIDVWEITANQVTQSWLKNPLLLAALYRIAVLVCQYDDQNTLDAAVTFFATTLAKGLANNTPGTTEPFTQVSPPDPSIVEGVFAPLNFFKGATFDWSSVNPDDFGLLQRSYLRASSGQDSFLSDEYVLRHTTSASNRGYFNVADTNVNCIYTQSQLYSEITDNTLWIFPCPPEMLAALNTIFLGLPTAPANYIPGGLKGGSSRVTSANNRVSITTEYKIANITLDAYDLAE